MAYSLIMAITATLFTGCGKASDGQCVIIIRGENVKVTFPDTIKEGRDSAESGGFYWEKNSGSYLITYRE